jgi:hypothetical protein
MSLADILRSGVATAKNILFGGELLVPISHWSYAGQNEYAEVTWGNTPVTRYALVENVNEIVRDPARGEIVARLVITFLEDVTVDTRDKLVLPSGVWTPIVRVNEGVLDSASGRFLVQVYVE